MTPREEVLGSDDLMVAIFCKLEARERHQVLPLVCRRWRLLSVNPALLQQTEVSVTVQSDGLPRLRSLCAFLQRHAGQHLRSLRLDIFSSLTGPEVETLIAASVSACAPSLEKLALAGNFPMPASAELEPSLTFLQMKLPYSSTALPSQLSALTNLQTLSLEAGGVTGPGYEVLRHLPALRVLELYYARALPAFLPSLVSLQSLNIQSHRIDFGPLVAALPCLSLTQLDLMDATPEVFAALTSQTRLRDLRCRALGGREDDRLVGGDWLRGLRRLGLSAAPLVASRPALAHATRLETAQVSEIGHWEQFVAVLGWAVRATSLQRLQLCCLEEEEIYSDEGSEDERFYAGVYRPVRERLADSYAMSQAHAQRPDLSISFVVAEWLFDREPLATDDED